MTGSFDCRRFFVATPPPGQVDLVSAFPDAVESEEEETGQWRSERRRWAVGTVQFPLTPASLSRSRRGWRDGGGRIPRPATSSSQPRSPDRRSLALASHRQCSSQPENHASSESRKRRRSSGLRPMARPDPVKESEEGSKEERVAQRPQLRRPAAAVPPQPPADAPSSSRLSLAFFAPLRIQAIGHSAEAHGISAAPPAPYGQADPMRRRRSVARAEGLASIVTRREP